MKNFMNFCIDWRMRTWINPYREDLEGLAA
jgi:hypothetical protein